VTPRAGGTRTLVLALLATLALAPAAFAQPDGGSPAPLRIVTPASGRCGMCHPGDRVAFEKSPHAREEVHCTSCHGGDDTTMDKAQAHSKGFTGHVSKAAVPKMCASCHSDEKRMRPYDLQVDQFELYQTSRHGILLAKGDTQVAVCSDCHGAHDILAASDPASRIFPTNIPRTCGTCHGDTTLVRQRHIKNAYRDYLTSVHAHQLFDRGNLRAPTCVSCHGVHGAAPPEVGDVTKVCGRCHTAERRAFIAGPHAAGMARNNVPECIACHGEHGIQPSVTERLGSSCVKCHEKGDKFEQMGPKMLADYQSAVTEIAKAEKVIAEADGVPMATEDYHARIEEARTYLREAMTAAHSVQPETVAGFTLRAKSVGTEIQTELHRKFGDRRTSQAMILVFWFYVAVTVGILRRLRERGPKAKK
jgi:predicted CXXCH cytochrome family protein